MTSDIGVQWCHGHHNFLYSYLSGIHFNGFYYWKQYFRTLA